MNTALSHGVGEKVSLSCSANLEIKENSLREGTYDATITPKIGFSERLVKQHNVFNSEDGRHTLPVQAVFHLTDGSDVPVVFNYTYEVQGGEVSRHFLAINDLFFVFKRGSKAERNELLPSFSRFPNVSCYFTAD
jgi:hypothetical protein